MIAPPSLPKDILQRAFKSPNGELGVHPDDAAVFLDACEHDGLDLLGWEIWLVDHVASSDQNLPTHAPGHWSGLIPVNGDSRRAVIHGSGNIHVTRAELAALDLASLIAPVWLPNIRVNFTLDL